MNITDYINQNGLNIELQVFAEANPTWEAYIQGRCDGFTTDKSGIAAFRSTAEDPGAHVILAETISKEPLDPLSPQSDSQFAEIIAWTVYGLIQAEELGISSENIDSFLTSTDPVVQRLLGQNNNNSGAFLGIPNDFMVTVIKAVGNYGEIYERHLEPIGLSREGTLNALWTEGGLLYSPPFR